MSKLTKYGLPIVLGLSAIWIVQEKGWNFFFTYYLPALTTLSAAFFGAYFAFHFQRDKEKEDLKKLNRVNGNIAIFNIALMTSNLKNIQQQIIDPVRNSPLRCLQMQPVLHIRNDDIELSIETLHFLLETDDRNLLGELAVEETRYQRALDAINKRSRYHVDEIQPLFERTKAVLDGNYTAEQIEAVLGRRLYRTIKNATEDAIELVDETIVSMKETADKLRISLKKQYPNEKVIGFE